MLSLSSNKTPTDYLNADLATKLELILLLWINPVYGLEENPAHESEDIESESVQIKEPQQKPQGPHYTIKLKQKEKIKKNKKALVKAEVT